MIATLTGKVAEKIMGVVVIDVQGVGYGVLATAGDYGALAVGSDCKLYLYEHIRENAHDLFGFISLDTKLLFEQLLDVNGVGPKMSLNILSTGTPDEVRRAIAGGDVKSIQRAAGVGKRLAERVVVDLKDKVGLPGVDLAAAGLLQSESSLFKDEAVEGLVSLGYSPQDAVAALAGVPADAPTAERIKLALRHI